MQSPALELALDLSHAAARNLIRASGDPDQDTYSELTRAVVVRLGRWGPLALTVTLYGSAEVYRRHILKGLPR